MGLNVEDVITGLDPTERSKVEEVAAEFISEEMTLHELRRTVEAMGGSLSLIARFPDLPPVELSGFAKRQSRD